VLVLPTTLAYWTCSMYVDWRQVEYRKYHDDFSPIESSSYAIPTWSVGESRSVWTAVEKTGSLSQDWIVVQHISVSDNMFINSVDHDTWGGAAWLFLSGGVGYYHFASRFKYRSGYTYSYSESGVCVEALEPGTGHIYTNNICWVYGGDPWESPQSPTHTLLQTTKYFQIVS